jgi:hypothetical protein
LLSEICADISASAFVGKLSSETGASSIKKFDEGFSFTSFSSSDDSANKQKSSNLVNHFLLIFIALKQRFSTWGTGTPGDMQEGCRGYAKCF